MVQCTPNTWVQQVQPVTKTDVTLYIYGNFQVELVTILHMLDMVSDGLLRSTLNSYRNQMIVDIAVSIETNRN